MKFDNETKETYYKYEIDLSDEERNTLLNYGCDNILTEEMDNMLIEWAIIDILKKQIKLEEQAEEE